jgi:hypothetical protein
MSADFSTPEALADTRDHLGEPMIFFFDKAVSATRIIDGQPGAFITELARRRRDAYGSSTSNAQEILRRQPDDMPRGSVFVSYATEDLATAAQLAHALSSAGVPVWLDKQRLRAGENYDRSLEHAIKDDASFFLSLISRTTESDAKRYVHRERAWAAQKHVDGFVFYIPLIVDDVPEDDIALEPPCFTKIHRERLSQSTLPVITKRFRQYVDQYRDSGRPRG